MKIDGTEHSTAATQQALQLLGLVGAAMLGGLVMFSGIVIFLGTSGFAPAAIPMAGPLPLPVLGLALALPLLAISFVTKGHLLRAAVQAAQGQSGASRTETLLSGYRRASLVAMALCEGAGMLVLILALLSGQVGWTAAVLLPIFGIVLHYPTHLKFDALLAGASRED